MRVCVCVTFSLIASACGFVYWHTIHAHAANENAGMHDLAWCDVAPVMHQDVTK